VDDHGYSYEAISNFDVTPFICNVDRRRLPALVCYRNADNVTMPWFCENVSSACLSDQCQPECGRIAGVLGGHPLSRFNTRGVRLCGTAAGDFVSEI
jgi:hypothetical protein